MAQDWDIKLRGNACASCARAFENNEICLSELVFGENGYERNDYCHPCWEKRAERGASVSTWQGRYQSPPAKPDEPLKHETAESLLRRLMEDNDESNVNVIFILTVMLERKKILVERSVEMRGDERMVRVYEHRKTGETFLIREPMLRLDQLEHVQTEVIAMLGGGRETTRSAGQGTVDPETGTANAGAEEKECPAGGETEDPGEDGGAEACEDGEEEGLDDRAEA